MKNMFNNLCMLHWIGGKIKVYLLDRINLLVLLL